MHHRCKSEPYFFSALSLARAHPPAPFNSFLHCFKKTIKCPMYLDFLFVEKFTDENQSDDANIFIKMEYFELYSKIFIEFKYFCLHMPIHPNRKKNIDLQYNFKVSIYLHQRFTFVTHSVVSMKEEKKSNQCLK